MARVLGLKQLLQKKFIYLEGLSEQMKKSFGNLPRAFIMIVWGMSGNGKSNFLMQIIKALMPFGKVLYISLEEGTEASIVATVMRHLNVDEHAGKIEFADHNMTFDKLLIKLKKKQSPQFIIIDSVQYWDISYEQYKELKETFPKKAFIFISHAKGKIPDGKVADRIRYDAGIKIHVEGYVAKVICRYGGNDPYVIWEDGARKYWGNQYRNIVAGVKQKVTKKQIAERKENFHHPDAVSEPTPQRETSKVLHILPPETDEEKAKNLFKPLNENNNGSENTADDTTAQRQKI